MKRLESVTEILDHVKESICDEYCKWPEQYEATEDAGLEKLWEEKCDKCPLNLI